MDTPSAASVAQKSLSTKLSSPKSALSSLIRFRASECHNHYAPPVQISTGIWRISNPFEQTIQFVCVVWLS